MQSPLLSKDVGQRRRSYPPRLYLNSYHMQDATMVAEAVERGQLRWRNLVERVCVREAAARDGRSPSFS